MQANGFPAKTDRGKLTKTPGGATASAPRGTNPKSNVYEMALKRARDNVLIEMTRKIVPFDTIVVAGLNLPGLDIGTGTVLATTAPVEFHLACRERDVHNNSLTELVKQSRSSIPLRTLVSGASQDPKIRVYSAIEQEFGIYLNLAVPIAWGGKVYGNVAFGRDYPFSARETRYLEMVSSSLHWSAAEPALEKLNVGLGLTGSETECLRLAAEGLTAEEIAQQSRFTKETVATYLKSATRKIGAANRTEAVARAIRRGIIS